jgi:hypothetical protein
VFDEGANTGEVLSYARSTAVTLTPYLLSVEFHRPREEHHDQRPPRNEKDRSSQQNLNQALFPRL